ncbi:unnamed protein product [Mesocestoides corti]|uniref:Solute carrier family 25 member 46 n=2 Tax=Mesocestoides corti TaxID=53468 RepID=A0A3P6GU39_MESCO|nr:unnamed protein product [Mesocestoides corti]
MCLQSGRYSPKAGDGDSSDHFLLSGHRQETILQATYTRYCSDLTANLWASLASDLLLYPLETIVVRLCVQGTRTLVDNLDTADSVLPIISSFDGPFDVLRSAATSPSGFVGLYRGFGALILQYAVQAAFLAGIKYAYEQLLCYYSSAPQPPPPGRPFADPSHQPPAQASNPPQSNFSASSSGHINDLQPASMWQPALDSERWRSSDPSIPTEYPPPLSTSFTFRGFNSGPFDALL